MFHQVCETVTETKCDIVGYTECITTEVQKTYKSQESGYDYFQTKECTPFTMEVDHWKEKFKCENVTKQNCVTKWKMVDGKKVFLSVLALIIFILSFFFNNLVFESTVVSRSRSCLVTCLFYKHPQFLSLMRSI